MDTRVHRGLRVRYRELGNKGFCLLDIRFRNREVCNSDVVYGSTVDRDTPFRDV